jgi:hypothetical protein
MEVEYLSGFSKVICYKALFLYENYFNISLLLPKPNWSKNLSFSNHIIINNRVIRKVRKHSTRTLSLVIHGEILKKNLQTNKYISIQRGMKLRKQSILVVNWVSSCLSFFLNASTAPNCTSSIISLKPCALNAEFQHFIFRFNKIS